MILLHVMIVHEQQEIYHNLVQRHDVVLGEVPSCEGFLELHDTQKNVVSGGPSCDFIHSPHEMQCVVLTFIQNVVRRLPCAIHVQDILVAVVEIE